MDRVEFELTKEQLDASIIHGYGYYGHGNPFKRDGKYYLSYKVGSSCD